MSAKLFVGTAGWTIPKDYVSLFRDQGSHLERYAERFNAVEINSSFYKNHQPKTYARWAASTPPGFRFSVKLLKRFTHELRLTEAGDELTETIHGIQELGEKLGVLLVQLPPSLQYDAMIVPKFFQELRELHAGAIACEPRHKSWSTPEAREFFEELGITKVCADPEPCPLEGAASAGRFSYHRWHGSPDMYRSKYEREQLRALARELKLTTDTGADAWCIFDNTALGYATENANDLRLELTH